MFLSIVVCIFVSLLIIILGERIWNYFKERVSVEKTDHVVRSQIDKYKTIIEELQNPQAPPPRNDGNDEFGTAELKEDLEEFMNGL
jgi:hypothetical protein